VVKHRSHHPIGVIVRQLARGDAEIVERVQIAPGTGGPKSSSANRGSSGCWSRPTRTDERQRRTPAMTVAKTTAGRSAWLCVRTARLGGPRSRRGLWKLRRRS
jgi:hypothetical protein